ncbi:hypothetical protein [Tabrizicola sp. M-4]|uniref:hypothetical protein n=1 Tax=Tabrizicola sp. M-4 TaxID=3055847 RepID=UPI003DA8F9D1
MNPIWLIRMAQWVRNPPSPQRVKLVFGVIALCLLIFGYEWLFGWPEALVPQKLKP